METLELLKTDRPEMKAKFVSILMPCTNYSANELATKFDTICNNEKAVIEFSCDDLMTLNNVIVELMDLEIYFGSCSFHEEG